MRKILAHRGAKGFTIIELMVSLMVLSLISLFSTRIYLNYTGSSRDIKARNIVYEEARILMERIVREVRQSTVDYEQYFNRNVMIPMYGGEDYEDYGGNYCAYSSLFYTDNGESIGRRNETLQSDIINASLDPAASKSTEGELYLINLAGNKRTILSRVGKKVAMLRMIGKDFGEDGIDGRNSYNRNATNGFPIHNLDCVPDERESDGLIDTWHCDPAFPCIEDEPISSVENPLCEGYTHVAVNNPADPDHSFVDISPSALDVVDLKFMITPRDDPWKAYNMDDMQIQPHVTIQLTVQANAKLVDTSIQGNSPSITLTSTVTTRNYDEVNSDCF